MQYDKCMNLEQELQGPVGLRGLWRLLFGKGFWWGFGTAFLMSPVLMTVLGFLVNGKVPTWPEQYKSFIIGDPLLAVIFGLLAVFAQMQPQKSFVPSSRYWYKWLGVGLAGSVLFITRGLAIDRLQPGQLLLPNLFYHHILLITVFVCALGGMTYVQFRRHPKHKLWIAVMGLAFAFLLLSVWDTLHPPVGLGP